MDRAQRRQRRLDQKIWGGVERAGSGKGRLKHQVGSEASNCESTGTPAWKCGTCGVSERDTPALRSGPAGRKSLCNACGLKWKLECAKGVGGSGNVSAEESTDGVTIYEGAFDPSKNRLEAQLHFGDARGLKWEKIVADRAQLKWEKIAGEKALENKELKTEIQYLKLVIEEIGESKAVQVELESKLRAEIQNLKEKNSQLMKVLETAQQVLQDGKSSEMNHDHAAGKGLGITGKNVQDRNQQAIGRQQGQQIQHSVGNGSGIAKVGHMNGCPNECLHKTGKSGSLEKNGHDSEADVTIGGQGNDGEECDVSTGPQQAPIVVDVKSENEPEPLFTAAQRKAALALVDQEFLMWLSSRTRRPTAKEMSFHKSENDPCRNRSPGEEAYSWTGIPGSLLLAKFNAETDIEKPGFDALTTLLRSVFNIFGGERGKDMLWCLVWTDCTKPEQLPGYISLRRDTKRAHVADDEFATRSGKVIQRKRDRLD